MMSCNNEYSISFRARTADLEEIDNLSDIAIEQTVDMIWEGKVTLSISMNEKGTWNIENKEFAYPQSRLRFEMKKGRSFIALIDGPIVNIQADMRSEPGQSTMILTVYDDSILLDNNQECLHFDSMKDSDIAKEIYNKAVTDGILGSIDVKDTNSEPQTINFRGTRMQLLRKLAKRNMMHAYILPGETPGKSIGCFMPYPEKSSGLTDLVLTGENKNIENFKVNIDCLKPSKVQGAFLDSLGNVAQKFSQNYQAFNPNGVIDVIQYNSQVNDQKVRPQLVVGPNTRIIHPNSSFGNDMDQRLKAQAYESGYALEATGEVSQTACMFSDILRPYNLITVRGVNGPYCGEYVITKVSHKITRQSYAQSFAMIQRGFSSK